MGIPDSIAMIQKLLGKGRYAEAEARARELLGRLDSMPAVDSLSIARAIDHLVVALWRQGKVGNPETRALGQKAISIKERTVGPRHPELAHSLFNLARVLREACEWGAAMPLFERALAIREAALDPSHPDVALSLNGLGALLTKTGDYAHARPVLERALAIREKTLAPDDPELAQSLQSLGNLLVQTGDYPEARRHLEQALAIREKVFGPEHPQVASTLGNVAMTYANLGDHEGARRLLERSLRILEKTLDPGQPVIATAMLNLGDWLVDLGEYSGAKRLFERALAVKSITVVDRGNAWHNLGRAALASGDYPAAKSAFEHALAIHGALGSADPRAMGDLLMLGTLRFAMGDVKSFRTGLQCEEASREHLRVTCRGLPERQALLFAATTPSGLSVALSAAACGIEPAMVDSVWDGLVQSRAIVLDEMAARHRRVLAAARLGPDSTIARLVEEFATTENRLANLIVRGPTSEAAEEYKRLLDEARHDREQRERELAEKSASFREEQARSRIGLTDVASALPRGSALVSFARFDRYNPSARSMPEDKAKHSTLDSLGPGVSSIPNVPYYLALVMRAGGQPRAVLVPLGPAQEIDSLVSRWSEEAQAGTVTGRRLQKQADALYRKAGNALREAVWDPVAPHLAGVERVFIVPDGALHLINFAALPTGSASFLVETSAVIHLLSTERDLVMNAAAQKSGALLAMGGPAFDNPLPLAVHAARHVREPARESALPASANAYRGQRSVCGDFRSLKFKPLPGTIREVKDVAELWRKSEPGTSTVARAAALSLTFTGAGASETRFKHDAPHAGMLHVATHGFFLGGHCRSALESVRGVTGLAPAGTRPSPAVGGDSPLLLSGLALAGANHREAARPDEDDGILTAEEIAALDLSGVRWAVLSACETGVGEVRAGEGVLGLRRAFQVAGASTLIMSLWSVEDEATREWMKALYQGRLLRHLGTAEAVREASLEVLRQRRARGESTHPFFWGAFVAAGDWR